MPLAENYDGAVGYDVRVGGAEAAYSTQETSISLQVSAPGQLCARARAVDSEELASEWSERVCKTFAAPPETVTLTWEQR